MKSFVDKLEAINVYNGIITRFTSYFTTKWMVEKSERARSHKLFEITCPLLVRASVTECCVEQKKKNEKKFFMRQKKKSNVDKYKTHFYQCDDMQEPSASLGYGLKDDAY